MRNVHSVTHDKKPVLFCLRGAMQCAIEKTEKRKPGIRGTDMELGQWVTGSMGHLGHLSRPGHRVIILTRCEIRVFPVFEKMPEMQNVHLKC